MNTRQTARDWLTVGTRTIDQASIDAFKRDGAVVLRGIFSDWTDRLRQGVAQVMADPSPLERSYHAPGSAPFFQDLCNWQRISSFKDSARWVGEGAMFVDRRGKGSPPFAHLTLTEGAPFEGPDFPLVYGD